MSEGQLSEQTWLIRVKNLSALLMREGRMSRDLLNEKARNERSVVKGAARVWEIVEDVDDFDGSVRYGYRFTPKELTQGVVLEQVQGLLDLLSGTTDESEQITSLQQSMCDLYEYYTHKLAALVATVPSGYALHNANPEPPKIIRQVSEKLTLENAQSALLTALKSIDPYATEDVSGAKVELLEKLEKVLPQAIEDCKAFIEERAKEVAEKR